MDQFFETLIQKTQLVDLELIIFNTLITSLFLIYEFFLIKYKKNKVKGEYILTFIKFAGITIISIIFYIIMMTFFATKDTNAAFSYLSVLISYTIWEIFRTFFKDFAHFKNKQRDEAIFEEKEPKKEIKKEVEKTSITETKEGSTDDSVG